MRTLVYIGTSLDGFIAKADGDIEWLMRFADDEAVEAYREFTSQIDAIVIGRGTFETVLTFADWPYDKPVFVLSRTLDELPDPVAGKAELMATPPAETLKYLCEKGFTNIYIDGGRVIQDFLRQDLIDELIIATVPVILGSGIPLFSTMDRTFEFVHSRTTVAANGLVRSYYGRRRQE